MEREDIATDVVLAEAAAWLVRLQSAEHTPELKAAFNDWMADPAHARAFERVTETWEIIPAAAGRLRQNEVATIAPAPAQMRRPLWPVLASGLLVALLIGAFALFRTETAVYATRPGQQQTVVLSDGSRVTLNTDSRMTVAYSLRERRVRLARGEAKFEVAKHPRRTFLVGVGNDEVRALGTVFTVRTEGENLTVVLVDGSVLVTRRTPHEGKLMSATTLSPGERLRMRAHGSAAVDRPTIDEQLAWLRGQAIFNDCPLVDAIAEINRYGGPQIKLANSTLGDLRVSGVFQTRDAAEFAAAVAKLDELRIEHHDGVIVLTR